MLEQTDTQTEQTQEDLQLEYTQAKRRQMVEELYVGNKAPADKGDKMVALAALSDMDKVTLSKMKLKTDVKMNKDASVANAALIVKLLTTVTSTRLEVFDSTRVIPELGNNHPPPTLLEGETQTGTQSSNYEEFMAKNSVDEN